MATSRRIYIAGPGAGGVNYPAFDRAEEQLAAAGFDPIYAADPAHLSPSDRDEHSGAAFGQPPVIAVDPRDRALELLGSQPAAIADATEDGLLETLQAADIEEGTPVVMVDALGTRRQCGRVRTGAELALATAHWVGPGQQTTYSDELRGRMHSNSPSLRRSQTTSPLTGHVYCEGWPVARYVRPVCAPPRAHVPPRSPPTPIRGSTSTEAFQASVSALILIVMSDGERSPKAEDWSSDGGDLEADLDVAGMTVGEYRRLKAQIEAEGRESLSKKVLEHFDAADAEMSAAMQKVQESAARHAKLPELPPELKRQIASAGSVNFGSMYESIARVGMSPAERLGRETLDEVEQVAKNQSGWMKRIVADDPVRPAAGYELGSVDSQLSVSPVDDSLFEGLAEAREEREATESAHREAELEALAKIAGTMQAMHQEQQATSSAAQATTSEVGKLRVEGRKSGRWTVVSAVAATVAAVFGAMVFFFPSG